MYLSIDKLLGNFSAKTGTTELTNNNDFVSLKSNLKSYISYKLPVEEGEEYIFTFFAKKSFGTPKVRMITDNYPSVSDEVTILSDDFKKYKLKLTIPYSISRNSSLSIDIGGINKSGIIQIFNPILEVNNTSNGSPQFVAGGIIKGKFDYSMPDGADESRWVSGAFSDEVNNFGVDDIIFDHYIREGLVIPYCDLVLAQSFPEDVAPIITLTPNIYHLCFSRIIPTIHGVTNNNGIVTVRVVFFTPESEKPGHKTDFYSKFSISISKS